jgi:hypothetical protein
MKKQFNAEYKVVKTVWLLTTFLQTSASILFADHTTICSPSFYLPQCALMVKMF